jgi:pyridoxal phosphate enzyme (YggS family)
MNMKDRIGRVQDEIERACARSGRQRDDVTLIAVSKLFPLESVLRAAELGIREFGESRVQELAAKRDELRERGISPGLTWHLVGHLQRNKARQAIGRFDLLHSLDSIRLAATLDRTAEEADVVCRCLAQVNVSEEDTKFGIEPSGLTSFLDSLAGFSRLRVDGLMTLASPVTDPDDARPQFASMRHLLEQEAGIDRPNVDLRILSMGMSGDCGVAIEEGATDVRVGTAIFGERTR